MNRRDLLHLAPAIVAGVLASTALGQAGGARPVPPPPGPPPDLSAAAALGQDWSWYPYELRPPFVGELFEAEDSRDVIYAGAAILTVDEPPRIPEGLAKPLVAEGRFEPGYFVVHFEREVRAEDKALLDLLTGPVRRADGSALSRWYVPNDALVAWIDSAFVYEQLAVADPVDALLRYEPAYKLDPTIGTTPLTSPNRVGRGSYVLNVDVIPGHDVDALVGDLIGAGVRVLERVELRGAQTYDVRFVVVEAAPQQVVAIARLEGVRMIQEAGDGVALYGLSGGGKLQNRALAADNGGASPIVTAATFPLWVTHDLQGQGQVVGVVDTSLDWNNVGTSGCNFGSPDTAISNYGFATPVSPALSIAGGGVTLKVPRADLLGGATLLGTAANEHGCAVAGAACADFYGNNDTKWWEHDVDTWESWAPSNFSGLLGPGIAHEAQLYFTPVMDSSNAFRWESFGEFEANMNVTLDNMAAAGVCATSHSVGLSEASNTYTQTSVTHDLNAFDHPDMLQCMAAGNSGAVSNALTSQAVIKNNVAVGASDDVLKPEDRVTFSSIGPAFDGRRKPDIMAPGSDTAARQSGVQSLLILPDTNGSSSASCAYQWTAGTSFSAPTITGAAALVHQYFDEGRYPGNSPLSDASAALMKAVLVNAGHRLTGANLGDGTYPNTYQGWGEPNLSAVLDFGTGNRRLIATDVPSSGGFTSAANANDVVTFTVNSTGEPLKVTLVWTDEPGSAGVGKKLINDLDLLVTAPGGALYRGNVFNGTAGTSITGGSADTINNVESVILSGPATGTWTATIDPGAGNYAVGQGYALVITGNVTEGGGGGAQPPVADFVGSPLSGQAPLLVSFTDLTTGDVTSRSWTFGDGGTSTATNPSHSYTAPGTYTVSLTATGPGGTDVETKVAYVSVSAPPVGGGRYFLTFDTTTNVPGLGNVADEDVVIYNVGPGTWEWYFDGSDVGLGNTDVNALHVLDDGTLVLSFDSASFGVPGLVGGPSGTTVEDSDLVLFAFTTSGASTSGQFQFIFDGSDVGLTTSNEDIDGIYEFPGGGLALSLLGGGSVPGVSGIQDEDVLFFAATQYGSTTIGSWSMHFDGSDVGFSTSSGEDLNAISFENGVDMLFSTLDAWSAAGGSGDDDAVGRFSGTFGAATSGSASLEIDFSALGISTAEDIDGLHFEP